MYTILAYYITYLACLKYEKYMWLSSENGKVHVDILVMNAEMAQPLTNKLI